MFGLPRAFWLLFIGTLINRTGGFVVPFLTLYLTNERGISISQAAFMVSLFGAGSFIAQLTGGGWVLETFGAGTLWGGCFILGMILSIAYFTLGRFANKSEAKTGKHQ